MRLEHIRCPCVFAVRIAGRDGFALMPELPSSLGALKDSHYSEQRISGRSVKEELRQNLICKLQRGEELFPGVVGYDDTVVPQIVNAVLSRHNFILLGLRGQAKTRIIRMLTSFLDERLPYITVARSVTTLTGRSAGAAAI